MSLQSYFINLIDLKKKPILAVIAAEDVAVLKAVDYVVRQNIVGAILFGNQALIERIMMKNDLHFEYQLVHCESKQKALHQAIDAIHQKKATMLVKGQVDTALVLKAVLNKEQGLRKDHLLSHVSVAQLKDRMIVFADGAMNIKPDIKEKQTIIEQCVAVARCCGFSEFNVGIVCAIEKLNHKMPCTKAAHILKQEVYSQPDIIVDGPFALDNALFLKAAQTKQIQSPIAGRCNILIMDDIESGNIFYKSLAFLAQVDVAGTIMGAQVPIVVTSRADSHINKVNAILLACVIASCT